MHLNNMLRFCWHQRFGLWISLLFITMLILVACSCSKSGTEPPPPAGLDTTSHDIEWQEFTFGYRNSTLNDVCIINENNIWAVGEIYLQDSTGTDIRYNAVHWNGGQWELKRINFYTICGQSSLTPYPAKSIFAFNKNNIWIAMDGDQIAHWNGDSQEEIICLPFSFSINKLWGDNTHSIYVVGASGNIVHFSGNNWQKQESGTDVDLTDIWGSPGGSVVWACGWEDFKPTVLLRKYNGGNWELVYNDQDHLFHFRPDSLSGAIFSVWTDKATNLYALTNYTLYKCNPETPLLCESIWKPADPYIWSSRRLRGRADNDLVAVGYEGRIWHFNGVSWRFYDQLVNPMDILNSVAISEDLVVAVGRRYFNGIEILGIVYLGER